MRDDEHGQAVPLLAAVVCVAGLAVLGVGHVGRIANERAQAQTAADAGALACVAHGGSRAAEALVTANGATLISAEVVGARCRVIAAVGGERAVARAEGR